MNPNYTPTAAAAAERAMQEVTRQTTEQLDKARLANRPEKVRHDEMNRVLDALESHPFRTALISQHLEVKHISSAVNGRVIVTLGSLPESQDPVQLEIMVDNASQYEDKNLVFEFMLAPRRVKDDTLKAGNSGHGPELIVDPTWTPPKEIRIGVVLPQTQEAAVSVAMPEKEHIAVKTDTEIIDEVIEEIVREEVENGVDEQARDRGGVEG